MRGVVVSRAYWEMQGPHEKLLTAAEVAERLGFTERYVWKLGREGALPRVKVSGRKYVRFCEADVEQFVRAGRRQAEERRPRVASPVRPLPRRF